MDVREKTPRERARAAATSRAAGALRSPVVVLGYTPSYPVANILLTAWGALMVVLMAR